MCHYVEGQLDQLIDFVADALKGEENHLTNLPLRREDIGYYVECWIKNAANSKGNGPGNVMKKQKREREEDAKPEVKALEGKAFDGAPGTLCQRATCECATLTFSLQRRRQVRTPRQRHPLQRVSRFARSAASVC